MFGISRRGSDWSYEPKKEVAVEFLFCISNRLDWIKPLDRLNCRWLIERSKWKRGRRPRIGGDLPRSVAQNFENSRSYCNFIAETREGQPRQPSTAVRQQRCATKDREIWHKAINFAYRTQTCSRTNRPARIDPPPCTWSPLIRGEVSATRITRARSLARKRSARCTCVVRCGFIPPSLEGFCPWQKKK